MFWFQVTHGDSPVLNAAVRMDIKVELNNGSVLSVTNSSMVLFDNGLGGMYNQILLKIFKISQGYAIDLNGPFIKRLLAVFVIALILHNFF